jgi:hypothetical protein
MRKITEILEALVLVAAIFAFVGLLKIEGTVRERLPEILANSESAARKFAAASDSIADTAREQDRYLGHTTRELNKTVADAHDLLIHTDESLNGRGHREGLLPAASALLVEQRMQLDMMESRADLAVDDLDAAEKHAQPILTSLNQTAQSAAATARNPQIAESLRRLELALSESDATLANLEAISESGNRDAIMIEVRLRQALKPARLLKSMLMRTLGIAAPAAAMAAGSR